MAIGGARPHPARPASAIEQDAEAAASKDGPERKTARALNAVGAPGRYAATARRASRR
jgi:hypothetical protein